jgi:hypothetical protein
MGEQLEINVGATKPISCGEYYFDVGSYLNTDWLFLLQLSQVDRAAWGVKMQW